MQLCLGSHRHRYARVPVGPTFPGGRSIADEHGPGAVPRRPTPVARRSGRHRSGWTHKVCCRSSCRPAGRLAIDLRDREHGGTVGWMPGVEGPPIQQLTYAQAAEMLGVHEITVWRMVRRGDLSTKAKWAKTGLLRSDVERLSLERWRPGSRTWLTATQVAEHSSCPRPGSTSCPTPAGCPTSGAPTADGCSARSRSPSSPGHGRCGSSAMQTDPPAGAGFAP